jgi:hypothetical protein
VLANAGLQALITERMSLRSMVWTGQVCHALHTAMHDGVCKRVAHLHPAPGTVLVVELPYNQNCDVIQFGRCKGQVLNTYDSGYSLGRASCVCSQIIMATLCLRADESHQAWMDLMNERQTVGGRTFNPFVLNLAMVFAEEHYLQDVLLRAAALHRRIMVGSFALDLATGIRHDLYAQAAYICTYTVCSNAYPPVPMHVHMYVYMRT